MGIKISTCKITQHTESLINGSVFNSHQCMIQYVCGLWRYPLLLGLILCYTLVRVCRHSCLWLWCGIKPLLDHLFVCLTRRSDKALLFKFWEIPSQVCVWCVTSFVSRLRADFYSKTGLKRPLKNRQNKYLNLNEWEHSAVLLSGPYSAVSNMSDCRSSGSEFDPSPVPYFRGD